MRAGKRLRALLLGGGRWQCALIAAAKSFGLEVLVADISPSAPGRVLADRFFQVDTDDRQALLAIASSEGVEVVLSDQTDRLVPVVAFLNEELGLPGIRTTVARRFTDKAVMREALAGAEVPQPRWEVVEGDEAAGRVASRIGYPLIVKPPSNQSSRGVSLVGSPEELPGALARALSWSTDARVLVEEFVEGMELTVEGVSVGGVAHVLAVSEKRHYRSLPCVADNLAYPPRMARPTRSAVEEATVAAVEALGLEQGIFHCEMRVRGKMPYLVEVAARGGGSGIASRIVPHVSGVDVYLTWLDGLLGGRSSVFEPGSRQLEKAAVLGFFDFAAGPVRKVTGLEEVRARKLAEEVEVDVEPGSYYEGPRDDTSRGGYFLCLGADRDEVDRRAQKVRDLVALEYE
jgi:biotin carboxylase